MRNLSDGSTVDTMACVASPTSSSRRSWRWLSAPRRRAGSAPPPGPGRRIAVIGRDPRASGEMLEAAVIAGVTSEGVDALRVGVLPTPAVATLTSAYDAEFGVMISASHNPMPDNGIKVFGPRRPQTRRRDRGLTLSSCRYRSGRSPCRRRDWAASSTPRTPSTATCATSARPSPPGSTALTVVVDCAHGAAFAAAPRAYQAAGAASSRSTPRPTD